MQKKSPHLLAKKKRVNTEIPAAWPFKEEILQEIEEKRARDAEETQAERDRRRALQNVRAKQKERANAKVEKEAAISPKERAIHNGNAFTGFAVYSLTLKLPLFRC